MEVARSSVEPYSGNLKEGSPESLQRRAKLLHDKMFENKSLIAALLTKCVFDDYFALYDDYAELHYAIKVSRFHAWGQIYKI